MILRVAPKRSNLRVSDRRIVKYLASIDKAVPILFGLALSLLWPHAFAEDKTTSVEIGQVKLAVEFKGLRNAKGKIVVCLFNSEKGFPMNSSEAMKVVSVPLIEGSVPRAQFTGLEPGLYAVSALHDENNNKKLDTNWIGIPREGVAASRDAKGNMAPPDYKDAVLEVTQDKEIEVTFDYW